MTHASLFSGIDGFGLAAEQMNWNNAFHCEINQIINDFLKQKYPNASSYTDICTTDFTIWRNRIDILTGGFPCQPYSSAGKQKGTADERHLWPEMLRAIREIEPTWIVGENVRGLINWSKGLVFHDIQTQLEAEGYEVQPFLLPASSVNAPHERYRIWFIAYSYQYRNNRRSSTCEIKEENKTERPNVFKQIMRPSIFGTTTNTNSIRFGERSFANEIDTNKGRFNALSQFKQSDDNGIITDPNGVGLWRKINRTGKPNEFDQNHTSDYWRNFPTQSPVCNGNDGVSTELLRSFIINNSNGLLTEKEIDKIISKTVNAARKETIKAGGNAVVPQVVIQIFKSIQDYTNNHFN